MSGFATGNECEHEREHDGIQHKVSAGPQGAAMV